MPLALAGQPKAALLPAAGVGVRHIMFPTLRLIAYGFILVGVLNLFLGLSTYTWEETEAHIQGTSYNTLIQNGYAGARGVRVYGGGMVSHWVSATYTYNVNGRSYTSSLIGFYIPVNLDLSFLSSSGSLNSFYSKAYYLPASPDLAVLKQGADFRVVLACIIIGVGLLAFRNRCITWAKNA